MSQISEDILIKKIRERDSSVMEIVYQKYALSLFGVIYNITGSKESSEELLQEVMLTIWQKIGTYDANKSRFYTWIVRIARNKSIDSRKTRAFKNEQKTQTHENIVSIVDNLKDNSFDSEYFDIVSFVEELNTKYLQVVKLLYFEGYSQAETADKLDIPLGTVKSRIRKALEILKKYLS